MLCLNCIKLAFVENANKTCMSCSGPCVYGQYAICEKCSIEQKSCSVCLKKIFQTISQVRVFSNTCSTCGKK